MIRFLCAFFVFCGSSFSLYGLDRHAFTFTHYDLNARIEPDQQRLGVRGTITLRNDSDSPQKDLALQISSSLNWLSIQLEGKPAEFVSQNYTSDIDHTGALSEAIVVLPHPIQPKQSVELQVGYEGVIAQNSTRETRIGVPPSVAKHSDWDQIGTAFTAVRGIGYVAWYPIATEAVSLSEGNSVFDEIGKWKHGENGAEMRITFSLAGAGAVPVLFCNGPGQRLSLEQMAGAYKSEIQFTFHLTSSLVPSFLMGSDSALDEPVVNISFLPPHKSGADDYALAVDQVGPFISKWFGDHRDSPETKAQLVDLPDPDASPFESGNFLVMPLTADETTMILSALRQITHLYFPSPRAWISDGLATYAQANYFLNEKGRSTALAYLQSHRAALIQSEKDNRGRNGQDQAANGLVNSPDEFYVQAKAMNVWWMLRDIVGEVPFTTALHNYNPHDDNRPDYLQRLIEAQAQRDLQWFFDDWVYNDRGLPNLSIADVYPRKLPQGGYILTVTLENHGGAGAEVPVTAHIAEGESTEKVIVPANSKASVRIVTPALPDQITANDGSVPESETTTHVYKIEGH